MRRSRLYVTIIGAGATLLAVCGIALATAVPAEAQCGSQASSCKNCHEVQGKDPVNADGTGWHQSHAFGDFCYICHAGNNQATEADAAHAGMVSPLSDVQAACQQCHPNDLQERALVYAKVLNVEVGAGGSAPSTQPTAAPAATQPPAALAPAEPAAPAGAGGTLVDYVQRYDENALGKKPLNVGNMVLGVLIVAMVIGGGGLVITREGLVRVSFKDTKPVQGDYPADVVDMVPDLANLKPGARRSLQRMLKKPAAAADLMDAVDKLTKDHDEQEAP